MQADQNPQQTSDAKARLQAAKLVNNFIKEGGKLISCSSNYHDLSVPANIVANEIIKRKSASDKKTALHSCSWRRA